MCCSSTNSTLCEPTLLLSTMVPSRLASASPSTGTSALPLCQQGCARRCAISISVMPANWRARSSCAALRILMQSLPLPTKTGCKALLRLMQTSTVGGLSVTEHTALAVRPARPCGPAVVITLTAADSVAMALRKSVCMHVFLKSNKASSRISGKWRHTGQHGTGAIVARFAEERMLRHHHRIAHDALQRMLLINGSDATELVAFLDHCCRCMGGMDRRQA